MEAKIRLRRRGEAHDTVGEKSETGGELTGNEFDDLMI
jgi:hypothetical protein